VKIFETKRELRRSVRIYRNFYITMLREVKCLQKAIRRKNKLIKRLRKELNERDSNKATRT